MARTSIPEVFWSAPLIQLVRRRLTLFMLQTPEKVKRSVQTVMRIKDNESLVIGGLISRNNSVAREKVPLLGEIPILGLLFSNTSVSDNETEVMIVVTPHIATEVLNEKTLQINGRRSGFMEEFKDFRPFKDLRQ